jgi:hypothetical protein
MPRKTGKFKAPKLDALPDTLDFRDRMFEPTLVEVPTHIPLSAYRKWRVPILNQGQEGACTGFGLATVAHYLLRKRKVLPDRTPTSPRMFYEMARRYDEWPGENYDGSSARGAMKGWYNHGVCSEKAWPYVPGKKQIGQLDASKAADAKRRPLGAYFRVNHRDLVAMHSAISEVGILYATCDVHSGWMDVRSNGQIHFVDDKVGGHAFAIVAYDSDGLWIQNSWGTTWGREGFGQISYDDWLKNATDVWVGRLGAPVTLVTADATATGFTASSKDTRTYVFCDLRPHIISIGNDGQLRTGGTYGTSTDDVRAIVQDDFVTITKDWPKKRLLLYAHGGLVSEESAIQHVADYRATLLDAQVYPLAFIWKTDYWTTLKNVLSDCLSSRRPEGFLDKSKDFMLDRLDDALEPIARAFSGKLEWSEMKENALLASSRTTGGARITAQHIAHIMGKDKSIELHIAGHSAGSILLGGLIPLLTGDHALTIQSCTLWAPACTVDLFNSGYLPALKDKNIKRFALFTLTDDAEQNDNCADIYHKSLLYLVSNAFEERARIPVIRDGWPILGMEKFVKKLPGSLFDGKTREWIQCPNQDPEGSATASRARSHGDFDDDACTLKATFARVLNAADGPQVEFTFHRSASSQRDRRRRLMIQAT